MIDPEMDSIAESFCGKAREACARNFEEEEEEDEEDEEEGSGVGSDNSEVDDLERPENLGMFDKLSLQDERDNSCGDET